MAQSSAELPAVAERRLILGSFQSLLVAGVALAIFGWFAGILLEAGTLRFDSFVRNSIHQYASPAITNWMLWITRLGNWYVILPASILLLFVLILKQRPEEARLLAVTMLGALLLETILKLTFHRARPAPFFSLAAPSTYSFPSGHALITLCFVGFLAGAITLNEKSPSVRRAVWIIAVAIVLLVGFSRIYLGVHYPSDVLAGYAAAFVWMNAVGRVAHREERARKRQAKKRH